jgi:hypothetical protein
MKDLLWAYYGSKYILKASQNHFCETYLSVALSDT